MRIFLDTNIYLDLITKRNPDIENLEKTLLKFNPEIVISSLTIANAMYITRGDDLIRKTLKYFSIVELSSEIIENAFDLNWEDYEDCLQYLSCQSSKCEVLLTNDKVGFKKSGIKVMNVKEFIKL